MAFIYVVLVRAETGLGKISRKLLGYEYTHIAVSFDRKLEDFVTFSRRKHFAPFDAGFMHEKREHYAFGKHRAVKVKVFRLPVSMEKKKQIETFVREMEEDPEYVFNLYSMLTMPFLHGIQIDKAYNCMSFVGEIIRLSGVVKMPREPFRYSIREMDELLEDFYYREGYLRKLREDVSYMEKQGFVRNAVYFLVLNKVLLQRLAGTSRYNHNKEIWNGYLTGNQKKTVKGAFAGKRISSHHGGFQRTGRYCCGKCRE